MMERTKQLEKSAVTYSWAQELYITDQIGLDSNTKLGRSWLPEFVGIFGRDALSLRWVEMKVDNIWVNFLK